MIYIQFRKLPMSLWNVIVLIGRILLLVVDYKNIDCYQHTQRCHYFAQPRKELCVTKYNSICSHNETAALK